MPQKPSPYVHNVRYLPIKNSVDVRAAVGPEWHRLGLVQVPWAAGKGPAGPSESTKAQYRELLTVSSETLDAALALMGAHAAALVVAALGAMAGWVRLATHKEGGCQ
jgi:hypothetical protein